MTSGFNASSLRAAYDCSRLVPFVGSGMSQPACRSWSGFIGRLEKLAGICAEVDPDGDGDRHAERALGALQQLRRRRGMHLPNAVREAVYASATPEIPESTRALVAIYWPLVCSTSGRKQVRYQIVKYLDKPGDQPPAKPVMQPSKDPCKIDGAQCIRS